VYRDTTHIFTYIYSARESLYYYFFKVSEVMYEEILPTLDASTLDDATEWRFTVPAVKDYFTR